MRWRWSVPHAYCHRSTRQFLSHAARHRAAANRLPATGFRGAAEVLGRGRGNVAWAALGQAIACYEIALDYAKKREQFGKPIAGFQLVQAKLVRMVGEIT